MIDTSKEIDASFFYRQITVGKMKDIISKLKDTDLLIPNNCGNLFVADSCGKKIGFVDFLRENLEEL